MKILYTALLLDHCPVKEINFDFTFVSALAVSLSSQWMVIYLFIIIIFKRGDQTTPTSTQPPWLSLLQQAQWTHLPIRLHCTFPGRQRVLKCHSLGFLSQGWFPFLSSKFLRCIVFGMSLYKA
jgi:hypothetical protein